LHDCVPAAQLPPLQVPASVSDAAPAAQSAAEHEVPFGYFWQPPAPSHLPLVPQLAAPWSAQKAAGAVVPAATGAHAPRLPATLQAWHAGQIWDPQQTLSMQLPLMHWPLDVQATPLAFNAQLRVVPEPWQVNGATQSPSVEQVVRHVLVPQT
jgi:hypothetical protein